MLPLCAELAAGIKDASGAACASYSAYIYNPGTLVAFTDAYENDGTTPITPPVTLDVAGRYFLRAATPFRLVVKDAAGATVYDHEVNTTRAEQCRYKGTAFNSNAETTVQAILDLAETRIGTNWMLKAGASSLGVGVKDWANGVHVDVTGEDVGGGDPVKGDGTVDCTAGIQAAITLVGSLGGGTVFFPTGTYKITAPLTVASANVSLRGTGAGSIIKNAAATNAIVISANDVLLSDLTVTSTSSAGYAVTTTATRTTVERCTISGHAIGVEFDGQFATGRVLFSSVSCTTVASSRGIRFNESGGGSLVLGCLVYGGIAGKAIEFYGADPGLTRIVGCTVRSAAAGVSFAAAYAGNGCGLLSCDLSGISDAVEVLCSTMPVEIVGCGLRGYTVNVTSGSSHTPDLTRCSTTNAVIDIHGTTNGANWTVNAPAPDPGAADLDAQFILVCKNDVAATGWTLNAAYHVSAAPSNTNGERTTYLLRWNGTVWHEVSRSVTS